MENITVKEWATNISNCPDCDIILCETHAIERGKVASEQMVFLEGKLKYYRRGYVDGDKHKMENSHPKERS